MRDEGGGVEGRAEATTEERGQAEAGREQQGKAAQGAAKLTADVHEMRSCAGAHLEGGEEAAAEAAEAASQGPHKHFRKPLQAVEGKGSNGTFIGSSNGVAVLQ